MAEGALDGRVAPALPPGQPPKGPAAAPTIAPAPRPPSHRRRLVFAALVSALVVAAAILAVNLAPNGSPQAGPSASPTPSGPSPLRLLAVIDVSGSMLEPVAGTNATRMQVTASAARTSLLKDDKWSVGLWSFSTLMDGQKDYLPLVPIGPVSAQRPKLEAALAALTPKPNGSDGLHNTIVAGYRAVQTSWQPGAANTLLVVADGTDNSDHGPTIDECIAELHAAADSKKPIRVVLVGVALDAQQDAAVRRITVAVGGATFNASDPTRLADILSQALTSTP